MSRWHDDRKSRARIEIIPMIDVMMFLLVFFVLISIDVIPAFGIPTRLPASASATANKARHQVILTLGRGGELQLDGAPASLDELVPRLAAIHRARPEVAVIVNGDQAVELQRVVEVMDRVKAAGITTLSIAARKRLD